MDYIIVYKGVASPWTNRPGPTNFWFDHSTACNIQLFRERLSEKMCTRQSRKVIWDMISTRFLTTVAVEPPFVAFLWHSQTHLHSLSYQFFQLSLKKKRTQNHPQCRIVACTFPDNLSRNSCIMYCWVS